MYRNQVLQTSSFVFYKIVSCKRQYTFLDTACLILFPRMHLCTLQIRFTHTYFRPWMHGHTSGIMFIVPETCDIHECEMKQAFKY